MPRLVVAVALILVALVDTAWATPNDRGCGPGEEPLQGIDGSITCVVVTGESVDLSDGGGSLVQEAVGVWRSWPVVGTLPDGTPCTSRDGAMLAPDDPAQLDRLRTYWFEVDVLASEGIELAPCPWIDSSGQPPISQHVEDSVAPAFPKIEPGYGITGMTAYLETQGSVTYPETTFSTTVAGFPVTWQVRATGAFSVDWGDGTGEQGPYHTVGAPWPDGTITHDYTERGTYTVTVHEEWTVEYRRTSPPPQTGWSTFTMRTGPFLIPAFDVHELQPVREY